MAGSRGESDICRWRIYAAGLHAGKRLFPGFTKWIGVRSRVKRDALRVVGRQGQLDVAHSGRVAVLPFLNAGA